MSFGAGPHPRGPAPGTPHAHTDSTRGCYSRPAHPARSQDPSARLSPHRRAPPSPQPARPPPRPPTPRQAKAQTTGRWSLKASAGSGSARGAGTRHPPEQGGPGEAAHTAAAVAARERERGKVNADTHAPRGGRADRWRTSNPPWSAPARRAPREKGLSRGQSQQSRRLLFLRA